MATESLRKKILDDRFLTLEYRLADLAELARPVAGEAFALAVVKASVPKLRTRLFDRAFGLSVEAEAPVSLRLLAADHVVDDLEGFGQVIAPEGASYADLQLALDVDVAGEGSIPTGGAGLGIGVSVGGGADARYRCLLPVAADDTRAAAVRQVLGGSFLPQLFDPRRHRLAPGEIHEVAAGCRLDLGLRARLGREFDHSFVVEAFGPASDAARAKVAYALDASLGYSLVREMRLTVGRVDTLREGWVRVRLVATEERRLAFALVFQLLAEYDLGGGLLPVLESVLELEPVQRLKSAMARLAKVADALADPDRTWAELKGELEGEADELIGRYLDDAGWLDWLEDDPRLARAFATSRRIVAAYRGLDERVGALWDQVLRAGRLADGQRLRELLEAVAGIDPAEPEALVDETWRTVLSLVEVLTGSSVEELLFGSRQRAQEKLAAARDMARRAADFLATGPEGLLAEVHRVAEQSGIESVVAWLEANTGSGDELERALRGEVSRQVRRGVCALLDRAWEEIEPSEALRARLERVAASIRSLLASAERWEQRLREELLALKGALGVSLAVEMERLAGETALVDLELDPSDDACRNALAGHLAAGRVTGFLGRLAEIDPRDADGGLDDPLPYLLRDCVLTTRRARSSSLSLFLSLLGVRTDRTQRLCESTVRFLHRGAARSRAGRSSAALVRSRVEGKMAATAAVWLELEGAGSGHSPRAPYDLGFDARLRLTYTRDDDFLTREELHGLSDLLADLGFVASGGGGVPFDRPVHLGLEYRIPAGADALAKLLGGLSGKAGERRWNRDLRNAAHRWFRERLVAEPARAAHGAYPDGERPLARHVLPLFVRSEEFAAQWARGLPDFERFASRRRITLKDGAAELAFSLMPDGSWVSPYLGVQSLVASRGEGLRRFRKLEKARSSLFATPTHEAALGFSQAFAAALKAASPRLWPSPLSAVWLILARLAAADPGLFGRVEGVATWRWSIDGRPADPVVWRLDSSSGLADPRVRQAAFPIL